MMQEDDKSLWTPEQKLKASFLASYLHWSDSVSSVLDRDNGHDMRGLFA